MRSSGWYTLQILIITTGIVVLFQTAYSSGFVAKADAPVIATIVAAIIGKDGLSAWLKNKGDS